MHVHAPPQVLPTSLTQLRLSYETNELGEDPWSDDDMYADGGDSSDEEDTGRQYAHIKPGRWHDWAKPLVAGLAHLTGAGGAIGYKHAQRSCCAGSVGAKG
jgi:hypothetical protein